MNRDERLALVRKMVDLWARDALAGRISARQREDEDFRISSITDPKEIIEELMRQFDTDLHGEDNPILIAARRYVDGEG